MKIIDHTSIYLPDGNLYLLDSNSVSSLVEIGNLHPSDINHCGPVILQFPEDTTIRCDKTLGVDSKGNTYDVYMLGNHDDKMERLLKATEKTLYEFAKSHPNYREGMTWKDEPLQQIAQQYVYYLLGKVCRINPELDAALGIKGEQS